MRPSWSTTARRHGRHLALVAHVGGHRNRLAAGCLDLGRGQCAGRRVDVGNDDLRTLGGKRPGDAKPNPVARPRDNRNLVLKSHTPSSSTSTPAATPLLATLLAGPLLAAPLLPAA